MLDGEQDIVLNATRGEASAFGLLYDHYQPQIYRFIVLKVGRREEAEDLTHHVFLSAWQNIRSYRHQGHPFSSWLYQIARNQIIDHYRSERQTIDLESVQDIVISISDTEATSDDKFEMERVMRSIRKMKPEYQDILIMRFVEELSIREVAESLRKSEGAVKLLQHRAMKQLKELMND
jgi:RNA polymerase sigma-70 factor, ECF subfamily